MPTTEPMINLDDEVEVYYQSGPYRNGSPPEPAHVGKVTKVGRKWATVTAGRSRTFDVDRWTGQGKPRNGFGAGYYALTVEMKERRDLAHEAHRLTVGSRWTSYATVEELRAVLAILEPISKRDR